MGIKDWKGHTERKRECKVKKRERRMGIDAEQGKWKRKGSC